MAMQKKVKTWKFATKREALEEQARVDSKKYETKIEQSRGADNKFCGGWTLTATPRK